MTDKQKLKIFFQKNFPLSTVGQEALVAAFQSKVVKKNTLLLREQQQEQKIRFLNKGVVREYYATDAKEININFYVKPCFISDFSSFKVLDRIEKKND